MPADSKRMYSNDSDTTLLKYFSADATRQVRNSVSESVQSEVSTTSSLLSSHRSVFSDRSGSDPYPPSSNSPPNTNQCFDFYHSQDYKNRPLPQIPIPTSSRTVQSASRAPVHTSKRKCKHRHTSEGSSHHSRTSNQPFLRRRCLLIIAIISITFSMLSCGLSAYCFLTGFVPAFTAHTFHSGDYEACVPCAQLIRDNLTETLRDQLFTKITKDDVEQCCSRNSGQLSAIVQNIIDKRKSITVIRTPEKSKFRASPVSAHKYLRPGGVVWREDGEGRCNQKSCHIKIGAELDSNREHVREIKVRNNSLEVNITGWYFIYASVSFNLGSGKLCSQLTNKTFRNSIVRTRPSDKSMTGTLMESSHTCCDTCSDDHHTTYSAGMFELKEQDQIYLLVSDGEVVSYYGNGTYLGLVLLRNNILMTTATPFTGQ